MKNRLIYILLLLVSVSFVLSACGKQDLSDEPFKYSITPGSEEWESLSPKERMDIIEVSDKRKLQGMTTKALVQTVMEYPFLNMVMDYININPLEANDRDKVRTEGFLRFSEDFAGVEVLKKREDAVSEINKYVEEHNLQKEDYERYVVTEEMIRYIESGK